MTTSLVTGGAGFIGSHVVDALLKLDHQVIVVDNEYSDNEKFHWNDIGIDKCINVKGDITDYKFMKNVFTDVDYVFHLAAEARIGPAIENPVNAVKINVLGTCTILQCAREAGVKRVVYSSTSSGYGENFPPNVETQLDDCLNPYSVSKVAGEKLCKMYTDLYDLPTIAFRYFNVYGDRAPRKGQYAPVIGIFFRQKAAGESLTIVGDGTQRRDFVHVSDVARANLMAAMLDISPEYFGQVFNIGCGKNYSVQEIADAISDNQTYIPPRVGEVKVSLANIKKTQTAIGWDPKVDLMEWINEQL